MRPIFAVWRAMLTPARAFQPASLEREFLRDYARRFANERRAITLLAALLWIPLAGWDLINMREIGADLRDAGLFVGVRVASMAVLLGVAAAATGPWMERNEHAASALLMGSCTTTFVFAYCQMRLLPPEYGHVYYGLALSTIMTAGFAALRLRGLPVLCVMTACVVAPVVLLHVEMLCRPGVDLRAEQHYVFKLCNILLVVGALGSALAQQLERSQRATFLREHELAHSNHVLARQRHELEALNGAIRRASQQTEEKSRLLIDAQAALSLALDAAKAASRAKSDFVANMSHEFRTPMNAIIGLTHLLMQSEQQPRQVEWLRSIETASAHLLSLINAILDISKIEAGKLELQHADFDLAATFNQLRALVANQLMTKGLQIELDTGDVPVRLRGDSTRLLQALLNYTGNAIKFTTQGTIVVRAELLEAGTEEVLVRFEVSDPGPGLSSDQLSRLFRAFEQADGPPGLKAAGTGLGLAITKSLATSMGGDAGATSEPGRGSTFWFTARLEPAREPTHHIDRPEQVRDARAELRRRHEGARVLLAEDNEVNQEVACALLSAAGISVEVAGDGREAVEKASKENFQLILMDVQMPVMDGLAATRAIRLLLGREATPILAMTADIFTDNKQAFEEAGMNDYVDKPCHPNDLYKALLKWLAPLADPARNERGPENTVHQRIRAA
jgi:signal transduction histidine kinase/FixJ family two-component response regulator